MRACSYYTLIQCAIAANAKSWLQLNSFDFRANSSTSSNFEIGYCMYLLTYICICLLARMYAHINTNAPACMCVCMRVCIRGNLIANTCPLANIWENDCHCACNVQRAERFEPAHDAPHPHPLLYVCVIVWACKSLKKIKLILKWFFASRSCFFSFKLFWN